MRLLCLLLAVHTAYAQGLITSFAGTDWLFPADNKPALEAPLGPVYSLSTDTRGNLFFADPFNHMVFRRTPAGVLDVVAGNGIPGLSGDGGPARRASLNSPISVTVDANGNLYIADQNNHRIRRVTPEGIISTYAGSGDGGFAGDGGPASAALLRDPTLVTADTNGNLYIADASNYRIRMVSAADARIRTIAGDGSQASLNVTGGLAADTRGRVVFSDPNRIRMVENGVITTIAGNGRTGDIIDGAAPTQTPLTSPAGLAFDGSGNLLFIDGPRIWRLSSDRLTPIAGNGDYAVSGDGLGATLASFYSPLGLARDPQGNLYVSDERCACIRAIDARNIVRRVAGNGQFGLVPDGTPAVQSFVHLPRGLAFDANGNLLVANAELAMLSSFSPAGVHRRLAGGQVGCCAEGIPAANAPLDYPSGVAVDRAGNIYLSETGSDLIRMIDTNGTISIYAGRPFTRGFSGDNGPRRQATFVDPAGLAFDSQGRLFLADMGNHRVRRIDASGTVTTVAGNGQDASTGDNGPATQAALRKPTAVAFLPNGTLLIADASANRVRSVDPQGVIRTFAGTGRQESTGDGGPADSASLNGPSGLAVDTRGAVFILEEEGNRIRRVDPNGTISTVAGTGQPGFRGDGGSSLDAELSAPSIGIAIDSAGNLFFSDTANRRIRMIRANPVRLSTDKTSLSFTVRAGAASASLPVSLSSQPAQVRVSVAATQPWLQVNPRNPLTPYTIDVTVDARSLTPGSYQGAVEITSAVAQPRTISLPVTVQVQQALAPALHIPTESLALSADAGQTAEAALLIANTGGGELPFDLVGSTANGDAWLNVASSAGTATPETPATVRVTASAASLAPGTYSDQITVNSAFGSAIIPVTFSVREGQAPRILLSQSGLTYLAVAAGGAPIPQTIGILNEGGGTLSWSATAHSVSGPDWITLSQAEGRLTQPLTDVSLLDIAVNPQGLAPGVHYARLEVTAPGAVNSPQFATIVLQVLPENTQLPPEVLPSGIIFTSQDGTNPGAQTVTVNNLLNRTVQYASSRLTLDGITWFSHSPVNAAVSPANPAQIVVQPDARGLTPGVRRGLLTLLFDDGSSRSVNILHVVGQPSAATPAKAVTRALGSCATTVLRVEYINLRNNFLFPIGQPATIQARAFDECGNFLTPQNAQSAKLVASFTNGDPDVNLVHIGNGLWTGTWKPVREAQGTVILSVFAFATVNNRLAVSGALLQGSVIPGTRIPLLQPGSLRHSATLETGLPVAPGQLITVLGAGLADGEASVSDLPLPSELNHTEVLLGGKALPLLFTSDGQINAQVPYGLPVNTQHQLLVRRGDTLSVPEPFVVAPAQPGVFTTNSQGTGQGFIFHSDGVTLADTAAPIEKGSEASLLCTGLGEVNPPFSAGLGAPDPAPTVLAELALTIGGQPAPVRSAELVSSRTGVYRVRFQIPPDAPQGDKVELLLTGSGRASKPVTLAIR